MTITYSEKIRREMAWCVKTDRLLLGYANVDRGIQAELIAKAKKHGLAVIQDDLDRGEITKRQATAARKAVDAFAERMAKMPIDRKEEKP